MAPTYLPSLPERHKHTSSLYHSPFLYTENECKNYTTQQKYFWPGHLQQNLEKKIKNEKNPKHGAPIKKKTYPQDICMYIPAQTSNHTCINNQLHTGQEHYVVK